MLRKETDMNCELCGRTLGLAGHRTKWGKVFCRKITDAPDCVELYEAIAPLPWWYRFRYGIAFAVLLALVVLAASANAAEFKVGDEVFIFGEDVGCTSEDKLNAVIDTHLADGREEAAKVFRSLECGRIFGGLQIIRVLRVVTLTFASGDEVMTMYEFKTDDGTFGYGLTMDTIVEGEGI